MNMNLKLDLNAATLKALIPQLVKGLPYIVGLALIGLFGYTAYFVNQAVNVQPSAQQTAIKALPKVVFYQQVIDSLSGREVVNGDVPLNLGSSDPFK